MEDTRKSDTNFAARATALVFGALAGFGGLTHGVGEILQGNVVPDSIWINSWAQGPIATNMGGEPGISLIPNLLVTGIVTCLISLATIIWALAFVQRRHGGRILILLSALLLLVGGGIGPPLIGIFAGVAGLKIKTPVRSGHNQEPTRAGRFFSTLWPTLFVLATLNGIFLVFGSVLLVYTINLNTPDLFTNSFYVSIILLVLLIVTGRAYDNRLKS